MSGRSKILAAVDADDSEGVKAAAVTALYSLGGLTLAALGFLPPILAAAAQSLPDLGILANSSRLIRQR